MKLLLVGFPFQGQCESLLPPAIGWISLLDKANIGQKFFAETLAHFMPLVSFRTPKNIRKAYF